MDPRKRLRFYETYRRLMADDVRLAAYRRAIAERVRPGDVVADLGTGLGILAFFAVEAGASHVYAIDDADVIELADELVRHNRIEGVELVRGRSTEVSLPEPVDVIITETLGSFGLDEGVAQYVADARDRWLKPGGRLIPEGVACYLAPADAKAVARKLAFWDELKGVWGVDHAPVGETVRRHIIDELIADDELLAEPSLFCDLDLARTAGGVVMNTLEFRLEKAGCFRGLAGWFHCRLSPGVTLGNGPFEPGTHWKQAFFPAPRPVDAAMGDTVFVSLALGPKPGGETGDTVAKYELLCYPETRRRPS